MPLPESYHKREDFFPEDEEHQAAYEEELRLIERIKESTFAEGFSLVVGGRDLNEIGDALVADGKKSELAIWEKVRALKGYMTGKTQPNPSTIRTLAPVLGYEIGHPVTQALLAKALQERVAKAQGKRTTS